MARTGYKIVVYLDDNPLSDTYMQTYQERVLDEKSCPTEQDDIVLISNECEVDESGYTGYRLEIYYDSSDGTYSENRVEDPECVQSSTEEQWVGSGDPYCEVTENGLNTGYKLQVQVQMNYNLASYGETRIQRYKSPDCGGNGCPVWEEIQKSCHISVNDCVATFDGTSDIVEVDSNPLSQTYNQTRTVNREDGDCENCTDTTFSWVLVGDMCGDDALLCSNSIQQVSTNSYTVSQKYKAIGGGTPVPMDEYRVELKAEDDEDCGWIKPEYRWDVAAGQYLCDYDDHTKYEMLVRMVSYDAGSTWSVLQPMETQRGDVIAYDSYDCGKPMYRWVETGDFVCEDNGDDHKLARVDASGNVITSIGCTDSTLTSDDFISLAARNSFYAIGNCVSDVEWTRAYNDSIYNSRLISIGSYVERIGRYGLGGIKLGYVEDTGKGWSIRHPLVLPENLNYLGYLSLGASAAANEVGNIIQFLGTEPPATERPEEKDAEAVRSLDTCIVPYGSLLKYRQSGVFDTDDLGNVFQEPWTARTEDYKLAVEYGDTTVYLAGDGTDTVTSVDATAIIRSLIYYLKSNRFDLRYREGTGIDLCSLKLHVGMGVRKVDAGAFTYAYGDGDSHLTYTWFSDVYLEGNSHPVEVSSNSFGRITQSDRGWSNYGESIRIHVPCDAFTLYADGDGFPSELAGCLVPQDLSCVDSYEEVTERRICEVKSGSVVEYRRRYVVIDGKRYSTAEVTPVATGEKCFEVTTDGGWQGTDREGLCKTIYEGFANPYYGSFGDTAEIRLSGFTTFQLAIGVNSIDDCESSTGTSYGTVVVSGVDLGGETVYGSSRWDTTPVTYRFDGGEHVISVVFQRGSMSSWREAVGCIYFYDVYDLPIT